MRKVAVVVAMLFFALSFVSPLFAADDPTIPVETKDKAKEAMKEFINQEVEVKGKFSISDDVENKILALDFDYVHEGVARANGGYLACVNLNSAQDVYDVDFIVQEEAGEFKVKNAVVHSVNKVKRTGHLDTVLGKKGSTHESKGSGYEEKGSGYEQKGSGTEHKDDR